MGIYTLSDLKQYPDVAAALGDMVVAWARMETALIGTLTRVTGGNLHQMQRGYYHLPTFESRIRFIRSLLMDWPADGFDKSAIAECIEKTGKLASARNHWIHGDWCDDEDLKLPVIFDHRMQHSSAQKKPVRAQDITNHVQAVHKRTVELEDLIKFKDLIPGVKSDAPN